MVKPLSMLSLLAVLACAETAAGIELVSCVAGGTCTEAELEKVEDTLDEVMLLQMSQGSDLKHTLASKKHSQPGWASQAQPSSVPHCPAGNMDCGYCKCTPAAACGSCMSYDNIPTALGPILTPRLLEENATVVTEKDDQPGFAAQARPSAVSSCPASFVDCAYCQCTPSSACGGCFEFAQTLVPHLIEKSNSSVVVDKHSQPGWTSQAQPSSVPTCPPGNMDCGYCKCTPASACGGCMSFGSTVLEPILTPHLLEENATVVTEKDDQPGFAAQARSSAVASCPASFVDCAYCQCTPSSACGGCFEFAQTLAPRLIEKSNSSVVVEKHSQPGWAPQAQPSSVTNCPAGNMDCGYCKCAPAAACGSCMSYGNIPTALGPILTPRLLEENATVVTEKDDQPGFAAQARPSAVANCPASFVDCAYCQCAPSSACGGCFQFAQAR